ncbi:MAG: hypothetical protein R2838_11315 [Caldilineaceae bacterium]
MLIGMVIAAGQPAASTAEPAAETEVTRRRTCVTSASSSSATARPGPVLERREEWRGPGGRGHARHGGIPALQTFDMVAMSQLIDAGRGPIRTAWWSPFPTPTLGDSIRAAVDAGIPSSP